MASGNGNSGWVWMGGEVGGECGKDGCALATKTLNSKLRMSEFIELSVSSHRLGERTQCG